MKRPILTAALTLLLAAPAFAQSYFAISSNRFEDGDAIPRTAMGKSCNGENTSPQLAWTGAPRGTNSFAVTVYDAETAKLHWGVLNIPVSMYGLSLDAGSGKLDALPKITNTLTNSFGDKGYTGPCADDGQKHHYEFTVYAMPYRQHFYPLSAIGQPTVEWLREHSLAKATITIKSE